MEKRKSAQLAESASASVEGEVVDHSSEYLFISGVLESDLGSFHRVARNEIENRTLDGRFTTSTDLAFFLFPSRLLRRPHRQDQPQLPIRLLIFGSLIETVATTSISKRIEGEFSSRSSPLFSLVGLFGFFLPLLYSSQLSFTVVLQSLSCPACRGPTLKFEPRPKKKTSSRVLAPVPSALQRSTWLPPPLDPLPTQP